MIYLRIVLRAICTFMAGLAFAAPSIAAPAYPDHAIRLIVPYAPGGPTDAIARVVAQYMSERLGQSVAVENRAGAGGNIGMQAAADAPADGYTLFFAASGPMVINPSLYRTLKLNPMTAFDPVGSIASSWNVLVALQDFPANTLQELIALAKQKPGTLTYGSSGNGSPSHLSVELLKEMAGIDMTHVPYRGSAPAIIDLLGGRISMMFDSTLTQIQYIKSGKVKALAQSALVRSEALPDVPTVDESGLPGFDVTNFFGLAVPNGTPPEVVARLNRDLQWVLGQDEVKKTFAGIGAIPLPGSPEDFASLIRTETDKWSKLVKSSGATVD